MVTILTGRIRDQLNKMPASDMSIDWGNLVPLLVLFLAVFFLLIVWNRKP